jgi:hypothetical protein
MARLRARLTTAALEAVYIVSAGSPNSLLIDPVVMIAPDAFFNNTDATEGTAAELFDSLT